jgi:hypothetical protein
MSSDQEFSESAEDSLKQRAEKRAEKEYQLILKKNEETRRKKAEKKKAFDLKEAIYEANFIAVSIANVHFTLDEIDKFKKKYPFYESLYESFSKSMKHTFTFTPSKINRTIDGLLYLICFKSLFSDVANLIHLELNDEEKTKHVDKILGKNIEYLHNKESCFYITLVEIYKWIIEKSFSSSKDLKLEVKRVAFHCLNHVIFLKNDILENLREEVIKAEAHIDFNCLNHVIFFKENILENLREEAIKAEAHIDFVKNKDYEQDL